MAISTVSDIGVVLTTAFGPDLVRLWNRRANLLANAVNVVEGDFKSVFWAVSPPSGSAKAVAEGYQVQSSDFNIDSMVSMTLARGQYIDAFSLSDTEVAVAKRSPLSPTKLIDMVAERVFESTTRLTDKINTDMFSGNGTDTVTGAPCIVGLDSALITSGSYGGNNVGSITSLQSNVSGADTGSGTALTFAQLDQDLVAIKLRSDEKPEMIVMHPYVFAQLKALYESDRRIFNMDADLSVYSTGPARAYQGADTGLRFNGIPIMMDKDAFVTGTPGDGYGHIYYVSRKHLELNVMPHSNTFDGATWEQESFISSGGAEDEDISGPIVSIVSLARLGLASTFAVNVELQLAAKRPLAMGRRLGVAI